MAADDSEFGREDALVCADVLGAFGVASDHVRTRLDANDAVSAGLVDDLERALQSALTAASSPTEFVRETIATAPRGVDAPAEFWTTAPDTQLGDVFAALDWTFDVKSANGRSLAVDDEQPYRLRVEDADGRTRTTDFSFPETPLGANNYPALVHAINDDLLFGLNCRFVGLSTGADRWRFALVETDELDRVCDRFGASIEVFDQPVLVDEQPEAYAADVLPDDVPVPSWACDDEPTAREREVTAASFDADYVGGLPHLDDATDGSPVDAREDDASGGGVSGEVTASSPDVAAGGSSGERPTGGRLDGSSRTVTSGSTADAEEFPNTDGADGSIPEGGVADAIEFVDDATESTSSSESTSPASSGASESTSAASSGASERPVSDSSRPGAGGLEPIDTVDVRDADVEADAPMRDDDLDGWSIGGTVDATTRTPSSVDEASSARTDLETDTGASTNESASTGSAKESASTGSANESTSTGSANAAESSASSTSTDTSVADGTEPSSIESSGFEWGPSTDSETSSDSETSTDSGTPTDSETSTADASSSDGRGTAGSAASETASEGSGSTASDAGTSTSGDSGGSDDDEFFSADAVSSFDAGVKTSRVEGDSFGVEAAEQTEDDEYAAVGAAMAAPARISVGGLLDDEDFLPEIPRAEPAQVRIEYEDEFDPTSDTSSKERETEDGFVWVNESGGVSENRSSVFD
jgi:hypothetical protein